MSKFRSDATETFSKNTTIRYNAKLLSRVKPINVYFSSNYRKELNIELFCNSKSRIILLYVIASFEINFTNRQEKLEFCRIFSLPFHSDQSKNQGT